MFCCLTSHSQIFDHEEVKYLGRGGLQQLAVTVAQSVRAFALSAECWVFEAAKCRPKL